MSKKEKIEMLLRIFDEYSRIWDTLGKEGILNLKKNKTI